MRARLNIYNEADKRVFSGAAAHLRCFAALATATAYAVDTDADGFSDNVEVSVGTDPSLACGTNAWPPDINNDNTVDITDVAALVAWWDKAVSPNGPAPARFDMSPNPPDGFVDISEVAKLAGFFGKSCICHPDRSPLEDYRQAGWEKDLSGDQMIGIQAAIYNTDVYTYTPDSRGFSWTWVMLTTTSASPYFVQIGPAQMAGTGQRVTLTQWWENGAVYSEEDAPNSLSSWPVYKILYLAGTPNQFDLLVDSQLYSVHPAIFVPNRGDMVGEITNLASQMMGKWHSHEVFTTALYQSSSLTWYAFAGQDIALNDQYADPSQFGNQMVSGTQDEIWDKSCP